MDGLKGMPTPVRGDEGFSNFENIALLEAGLLSRSRELIGSQENGESENRLYNKSRYGSVGKTLQVSSTDVRGGERGTDSGLKVKGQCWNDKHSIF